ncbi:MAG TPA: ABC transporter substrate binding protein [Gammaproteobacteria bacterium]|nr:ABC transporter substrate binding protein [Gammaproteobacteria bacterium]
MRLFTACLAAIICALTLTACQQKKTPAIHIGIVVPLQHKAMDEIVEGFAESLKKTYHQPFKLNIANAQNDANLERAIISQMRDENVDIIVPIGTDATQMTAAIVHSQPIVSLASDFSEKNREKLNPCNMAIVHDEISPVRLIQFIHAVYPSLTQLTLIHSSANKVFPEVAETIAAGKKNGIKIKDMMVTTLPELISTASNISDDTQGIFILKDHLLVSGVSILAKIAKDRHIPLMTSDQGSVQDGAGFALGVHEKEIGVEGGKLAAAILNNTPSCHLPIAEMNKLTVFINKNAMQQFAQNSSVVANAAKKLHYGIEFTSKNNG